jgi:transcriptional regulator with PAS, ATPase and Fis domain
MSKAQARHPGALRQEWKQVRKSPNAHHEVFPKLEDRMPREDMSLDEARQVIACWLESIDVGDLTDDQFEAAILSNPRLNTAFDTVAASAVGQFAEQVQHGSTTLSYESRASVSKASKPS